MVLLNVIVETRTDAVNAHDSSIIRIAAVNSAFRPVRTSLAKADNNITTLAKLYEEYM